MKAKCQIFPLWQTVLHQDCETLKRFSFSFSGIDFVEDVFVTGPDDQPHTRNQSMPTGSHNGNICTGQIDLKK